MKNTCWWYTCILIDIADDDPSIGETSARCLNKHLSKGLLLSPVSFIELAPVFDGSVPLFDEFLAGVGVAVADEFGAQERRAAFKGWARHITQSESEQQSAGPWPGVPGADVGCETPVLGLKERQVRRLL